MMDDIPSLSGEAESADLSSQTILMTTFSTRHLKILRVKSIASNWNRSRMAYYRERVTLSKSVPAARVISMSLRMSQVLMSGSTTAILVKKPLFWMSWITANLTSCLVPSITKTKLSQKKKSKSWHWIIRTLI